jgi:hypothetical protein
MSSSNGNGVKVLYIGGVGRSGSTLLDLLLGQIPGFFAVGELKYIWNRGLQENQLCGCGQPFRDCPFWQEVGRKAFGGWDTVDLDAMLELEDSVDSHQRLPVLVSPGLSPRYKGRLAAYGDVLHRLYAAVAEVSGSEVVVDSTKRPGYGFVLRRAEGIDLRVVHLVRDSRGVAFSWNKRVQRPEVHDRVEYMPSYSSFWAGARWTVTNALFHLLRACGADGPTVRYEQLVREPRGSLERIATEALGHESAPVRVPGDADWIAGHNHAVAGNPLRLKGGELKIRADEEWRTKMGARQRLVILLMTWPLLLRYGYLGKPRAQG